MANSEDDHVALKVRVVRIYGTDDQFGDDPRTNPLGEPVALPNFPRTGDRGLVWLGEVPPEVASAEQRRAAIGTALMRRIAKKSDRERPFGDLVQEAEDEQHDVRLPLHFTLYDWYLTLAVERSISLPQNIVSQDKGNPLWIDPFLGVDAAIQLVSQLDDVFEIMASAIALRIGGSVLKNRAVDDHVHFLRDDDTALSLPELSAGGTVAMSRPIESLHLDDLMADLRGIASIGVNGLQWFTRAAHWYAAAEETSDAWREFEFAFFSLEILANKLEPRLRNEARTALAFQPGTDSPGIKGAAVASLLWSPERQPLVARFATVALCLAPNAAAEDIADFADIKKRRGELAHGQIKDAGELPSGQAKSLAEKYLRLGLQRFLWPNQKQP
jgi:hypothetical protein